MELRIAPTEHSAAGDRGIGEIEIRGTSMMSGYLGQGSLDAGAWFRTGDLGISDRRRTGGVRADKELITVAGRNLFPSEVERVAAQVRGVRDGAVVAVSTDGDSARRGSSSPQSSADPTKPGREAMW